MIEENYSPYCKNCTACGEEGCCSHLMCVRNAMDNNVGCSYKESYYNEVVFNSEFKDLVFNLVGELRKGKLTKKSFLEQFDGIFDKLYDEIWTN